MERFFDIIFSTLAILVFSPFLVPIILLLRFSGEGEIFFFQERVGRNGKVFKLFKFATMIKESPNIGSGTITIKNDPRVLPVGKFLRKTKVNELPQLLNILIGDMSIIGPRPMTQENFGLYSPKTQEILKKVRPGLSGIGSIVFRREEEIMDDVSTSKEFYKNIISPYKGSLEEWFALNKSLKIYFLAIFITLLAVVFPKFNTFQRFFRNLPQPPQELRDILNNLD